MAIYAAPGQAGAKIQYKARYDNFIGGKWTPPVKGQYFDVITPISGKVYTKAARSDAADIELALDAAHAAADKWGKTDAATRSNILLKIADRIEQNLELLAYAETIVNSRRNYKGLAKSAIKRELNEKGVSQELVEEAISGITAEDDFESAKQLATRRFGQMAHLDKEVRTRRLAGYLQRKGYASSAVFAAIKFAEEAHVQEG